MTASRVVRNDAQSRYEIFTFDGSGQETLAGFAEFTAGRDKLRFVHTEVDPAFKGQGLANLLAAEALADAAARGETIVPLCPFIAKYLETHEVAGAVIDWPRRR